MNIIKHKKVKTLKELRNHPAVDTVEIEDTSSYETTGWIGNNGKEYHKTYWLYLKRGYFFKYPENGSIRHEATLKDLLREFYYDPIVFCKDY
tara:strand:- start:954 stop:1229 length:276 start_codon:yes stop_codon:yes gene_type:complete